jgi:transcription initiation factor IIE alpha subunit
MTRWEIAMAGRITAILRQERGLTDEDLAGRLNLPMTEVRRLLGMLWRQRRVDRCREYAVAPPERRAA